MITDELLSRVACPTCLEARGCPRCLRPEPGPVDYAERVTCGCGGPDKVRLQPRGDALVCAACSTAYPVVKDGGYLDLRPKSAVGEVTQYADHEFHERLGVTDAPPLLSARVKADMMRRMLDPQDGEALLDLGCGAGKLALYARARGARAAGLDIAPFFLPRAQSQVELVIGDLRRMPFRRGGYPRAYSLDVLEHLDEDGVREVLIEARRTVGPLGRLFVYTHAMESSRLAGFQRAVNRLARRLGRRGLIDHEREAMRKSDHKNAIRSHEHFDSLCAQAGLRVAERRYYNVFFKALIEDLLLRLWQHSRGAKVAPAASAGAHAAHAHATRFAPAPGRLALALGSLLTFLLKLDVVLFGGVRTGPFFGLLRPFRP
jgi:SAM-dependent methyltransferase